MRLMVARVTSWVKVWEWFLGVSRGLSEVDSPIEVRFKYVLSML